MKQRQPVLAQQLARDAIVRALALDLTPRELRVLLAVVALVPLYDRPEDDVWTAQVVELTRLDVRHARQAMRRLADKGVINRWAQPGRKPAFISFVPDETGPAAAPFSNREIGPIPTANRADSRCKPGRQRPYTEVPKYRGPSPPALTRAAEDDAAADLKCDDLPSGVVCTGDWHQLPDGSAVRCPRRPA